MKRYTHTDTLSIGFVLDIMINRRVLVLLFNVSSIRWYPACWLRGWNPELLSENKHCYDIATTGKLVMDSRQCTRTTTFCHVDIENGRCSMSISRTILPYPLKWVIMPHCPLTFFLYPSFGCR